MNNNEGTNVMSPELRAEINAILTDPNYADDPEAMREDLAATLFYAAMQSVGITDLEVIDDAWSDFPAQEMMLDRADELIAEGVQEQ